MIVLKLVPFTLPLTLVLALAACDVPECIDGPSNLTPEATASCVASPTPAEPAIVSSGAELLAEGNLILTLTSWGMECGTRADDVLPSDACDRSGWIFTIEIPPELAVLGVIDLSNHPEVRGTMTVMDGGNAGSRGSIDGEPFLVGTIELTQISEGCVTGVLHGFGSGDPDPTLGGPELEGAFVAPTC